MKLSLIKYPVAGGGGSTPPAGSDRQIQFNNAGTFGASANLLFDASENLLVNNQIKLTTNEGSGTSFTKGIIINNLAADGYGNIGFINDANDIGQLFFTGSTYSLVPEIGPRAIGFYNNGAGGISIIADLTGNIRFSSGGQTEGMRLENTGNLLIGTITDAGQKLQVNGNTFISGSVTIGPNGTSTGSINLFGFTDGNFYLDNNVNNAITYLRGNGNIIAALFGATGHIGISSTNDDGSSSKLQVNGTASFVVQDFVDNAAALIGGLIVGQIYRNGDTLQIVH